MFLLTGRIPWSLWLITILSVSPIKDSIAYQDLLTGFNIEYLRTSNYIQCSKWTIEEMRYDVLEKKDISTLLQENMKWNIKVAARNYILPEVPIKVIYVFQMQCKLTTGCLDMIYILPYHEAMQMTSISATNTESRNKLEMTNINPIKMNYNCVEPLDLKNEVIRPRNIPDCTMCYPELYRITMDKAVNNDQVIHIRIEYYLNRPYEPLQKKLALGLQQQVLLPLHTLITVPYHIQVQRTRFTFENDMEFDIHSLHTYANIQKIKHNVLVTKHFEKVEFMSTGETMVLKFNYDETMEYIPKLNKNVYIPLWSLDGNMAIQESYIVYNDASPIEGHFSLQIEHPEHFKGHTSNVVTHMEAIFPEQATKLRYYDVNGNISRLYRSEHSVIPTYKTVEIQPRYPILGSWKVVFTLDYRMPPQKSRNTLQKDWIGYLIHNPVLLSLGSVLQWTLKYIKGDVVYIEVHVFPVIYYMFIHDAVITIRLPLGAHLHKAVSSYPGMVHIEDNTWRVLGVAVKMTEVKVQLYRLYTDDVNRYTKETIQVGYRIGLLWLIKVMASLVLHIATGYLICMTWKWVSRVYYDYFQGYNELSSDVCGK